MNKKKPVTVAKKTKKKPAKKNYSSTKKNVPKLNTVKELAAVMATNHAIMTKNHAKTETAIQELSPQVKTSHT